MQAKPFFIIAVLLLISSFSFAWLPGWSYRTLINISSTNPLSDYQVAVNTTNLVYNNTGLVGSWHFSEGSGTRAADSSGKGNDGTLAAFGWTANSNWTQGKFGNGLQFDGTDDSVEISDADSLDFSTADFTLSVWFKAASGAYTEHSSILTKQNPELATGWAFQIVKADAPYSGNLYFRANALDHLRSAANYFDDTWHYAVVTRASGTFYLYVDGVQRDSKTVSLSLTNADQLRIGRRLSSYNGYFRGAIDEASIYNRALSISEIQTRYNSSKLRPDYSDLRFANSTDSSLPFWLESDNKAWVKVPSILTGASNIYAYYGNPSAASASNGSAAFDFFDDFDAASIDLSKWKGDTGKASLSNGILTFAAGGADSKLISTQNFAPPRTIQFRNNVPQTSWSGFGFQIEPYASPYQRIMGYADSTPRNWMVSQDAAEADVATNWIFGAYNRKTIKWDDANSVLRWYQDDVELTGSPYATGANIPDESLAVIVARGIITSYTDYVLMRKYASAEPTTSLLAEDDALQLAYRKTILLNNTGSSLTDYQVNLTIDTAALVAAGKMKSDCSDLRFTNSISYNTQDWTSKYSYWIESGCNTNATWVWVKVPSIPNGTSTMYAYYGNSSALSASNGAGTFVFFDDFSGDLSNWILTQSAAGNVQPVGGEARLTGNTAWNTNGMTSIFNISRPATIEWKSRTSSTIYTDEGYSTQPLGQSIGLSFVRNPTFLERLLNGVYVNIGSWATTETEGRIDLKPTQGYTLFWGGIQKEDNAIWTADGKKIAFQIYTSGQYQYINDIRVRKYASPSPTATEQQPDTTAPLVQIQSPTSQAYNTSSVNVNFTATDNIGISSCAVRLNGTVNSSTCSNYTLTLSNGAYNLTVTANDTAGNLNSSQALFTVATDTTPPVVQMQSPTNTTYSSLSIPLNFTASDPSGVAECRYELNGGANNTLAGCANTTITAAAGANSLTLWASDGANWNSSTISFSVAMQQRVSNTTTTDSNGIGNASLNGIPANATQLSITAGSQSQVKAIRISQGATALSITARVTAKQAPAQGKSLTFELY